MLSLRRLQPSRLGGAAAAAVRRHAASAAVTPPDTTRLVASLEASHAKSIESLVPWFAREMPPTYFRVFGEDTQRRHLRAIAALFDEELRVDQLALTSHSAGAGGELLAGPDSELHTFLARGVETSAAKLADRVASLPGDAELRRVLVFRSEDGRLSLDIFETGRRLTELFSGKTDDEARALATIQEYANRMRRGDFIGDDRHVRPKSGFTVAEVLRFLHRCPSGYVTSHDPRLFFKQMSLVQSVQGTEDVSVEFEHGYDYGSKSGPAVLVTVALGDCRPRRALQGALCVLGMHGLTVERVLVDAIADPPASKPGLPSPGVTLLRAVVRPATTKPSPAILSPSSAATPHPPPGATPPCAATPSQPLSEPTPPPPARHLEGRAAEVEAEGGVNWSLLEKDLRRFKWLGDKTLSLAATHPSLGLERAEVAVAYAKLSLALLDHPLLSRNHVLSMLERPAFEPHVAALADLFRERFHPTRPLSDEQFGNRLDDMDRAAAISLQVEESRALVHAMSRCLRHTIRTNAPLATRRALTLRLDPPLFAPALAPLSHITAPPFGIFFVSGRHFSSTTSGSPTWPAAGCGWWPPPVSRPTWPSPAVSLGNA